MKKHHLLFISMVAGIIITGCGKIEHKIYNEGINIIPTPQTLVITDSINKLRFDGKITIGINSSELTKPAQYLAEKLATATGYKVTTGEKGVITIALNPDLTLGQEGYTLESIKEGVIIQAITPQGAFYGIQTLLQLLPAEIESPTNVKGIAWEIPLVKIEDQPRFAYRGMHLDVCRHFSTVEQVKRHLDIMAMYKINRFHFHLTDDQGWRIEIKQYPELTVKGAVRTEGDGSTYGPFFFTQEQIKEIVAYASDRYIDVIPEIELPGHAMAALSAYPEYSCTGGPFTPRIIWGVEDEVYCAGNEEAMKFLENIITEVAGLFPSKYFHIGGDECPKVRWEKCPKCQALAKSLGLRVITDSKGRKHTVEEQIQSYVVKRMEKHASTLGKRVIGWDEILEGGLPEDAIVMSWQGESGGIAAANENHEVIMTPITEGMYINNYQGAPEVEPVTIGGYSTLEKVYNYEPIPTDLPADKHHFVIGAQVNMWTEYALDNETIEYMIYPRVVTLAEMTWTQMERKNYKDFERRTNNAYVRLDMHGLNYHIPMPEGVLTQNVAYIGDSVSLEFTNTRNYPMIYTTDGSEPTALSTIYDKPIVVSADCTVKIATMLQSGKMSKTRSIPVTKQSLAQAVTPHENQEWAKIPLEKGMQQGVGAVKRVAQGLFVDEASFANAKFAEPTVVKMFTKGDEYDMNKPSLTVYEGYVEFPEDGIYTLASDMDELWIDGERVISNPKLSRHNYKKTQKALASGKHSYKLVFNNMVKDGWPNMWTSIGFSYILPSGGELLSVEPKMLTY